MTKVNRFILEYQTLFKECEIDYNNCKPPKKSMQRFIRLARKIDDTRQLKMIDYPLSEIVVIVFMAVLGGASNWEDMEMFGNAYKKWLGKFLVLQNGIPSHDTFRRVFGLIKSKQLEEITVLFISEIVTKLKKKLNIENSGKRHISVDGKEANATGRKAQTTQEVKNLQTLHIYDNSHGICLYSAMIDSKTNEIPVAQSILGCMELKDTIVSFDAMNTQKKTVSIIVEQKGDYVGALKGNHETFEKEVCEFFTDEVTEKIKAKGIDYYMTKEKAHNQIETREYFMSRNVKWFEELDKWAKLKSFVLYRKNTVNLVTGKETVENRFYITSVTDVLLCAETIRGHWGVENSLHWHLDSTFGEDDNTTMDKNAFNNLSIINKMTLSLLKLAKPVFDKSSIRSMRKQFGWVMQDCLSKVLNFLSEDEILESLKKSSS